MSLDITIRPAHPGDIPRMSELLLALFSIESDFAPDQEKQAVGLRALIADETGNTLAIIAVADKTVVGMATVQTLISTAEGGRVGLIEDVIVDTGFRGKGIGTLLLREIVAWSRKSKLKRLQLLADSDNRPALEFYFKNGWSGTKLLCRRKTL